MIKELHKLTKEQISNYNNKLGWIAYPIIFLVMYSISEIVKTENRKNRMRK